MKPALTAGALVLGGATVVLAATAALFAGSAVVFARVRLVSEPVREPDEDASLVDGAREGLRSVTRDRGLLQHIVEERMLSRAHALTNTIESWGFAGAALLGGTPATVLGVFAVSGVALLLVAAVAGRALLPRSLPLAEPLPA